MSRGWRAPGGEDREAGYIRHDLDQVSLAAALDDARSLSLFATRRVIWLASAESALPRGKAFQSGRGRAASDDAAELAAYLAIRRLEPCIVIDAARFDFDGEDKAKLDRAQKFYSAVAAQVEFRPFTPEAARALAQTLARECGLSLGSRNCRCCLRLRAAKPSASREIEKLSVWAGPRPGR